MSEASRFNLNVASLETSSSITDYTAKFTGAAGRNFVEANDGSLKAAVDLFTPDSTTGTWATPYAKLRTVSSAYPGTMVVYADVPTTGLSSDDATDLSELLTFAVSDGQTEGFADGQLPPGYLPLTSANGLSAMIDYTNAAAADVLAQNRSGAGRNTRRDIADFRHLDDNDAGNCHVRQQFGIDVRIDGPLVDDAVSGGPDTDCFGQFPGGQDDRARCPHQDGRGEFFPGQRRSSGVHRGCAARRSRVGGRPGA